MSACSARIHGSSASIGVAFTAWCWRAMAGSLVSAPAGAGRRTDSSMAHQQVGNNY
ncbi:hypothetical protein ALMP_83870 [Streptomyces sp. A012304]|nr:hypothetical protein ALMP_83870 [Streptomyces sp. A012304]